MKLISLVVALCCLALAGCSSGRSEAATLINNRASLTSALPLDPFEGKVIATFTNPQTSTMSTLFGNDIAVSHARSDPQNPYPAGSTLSLVTWEQQEDAHWFGAKIPGDPKSIEFVTVKAKTNLAPVPSYDAYEGSPLKKTDHKQDSAVRTSYILNLRALVMP